MSRRPTRNRLLMVVHSAKRQGAQNVALSHARSLAADHDLLIAIGDGPLRDEFAQLGVILHAPSRAPIWGATRSRWAVDVTKMAPDTCRLAFAARRHDVAAIIANSTVLVAPVLAARASRVPVIVVAHEAPDSKIAGRLFRFHGALANTVIAISPWVAQGFEGARARIVVSPPGIPIPLWRERTLREPRGALQLLLVGTIDIRKRHADAIRALERLTAAAVDARLEIVGRADEDGAVTKLVELAERLGVGDRVSFVGERSDVAERMRSADVVVVPGGEVTPLVLMESMAIGTPVVAARMGSISDVVKDGETGILFEPGNVDAMASAISRINHDAELGARLAVNGRADVEARFDERYSVEALRRELDLLLRRNRLSGGRSRPA